MGHARNYTLGDVINRYQRLKDAMLCNPCTDAFGLLAENAAIKHGVAPAAWTKDNIAYMRGQMQRLGFGFDWSREFATCDPDYYRWEQRLFVRLYKKGFGVPQKCYEANWDPVDQTVLANEQVEEGGVGAGCGVVDGRETPVVPEDYRLRWKNSSTSWTRWTAGSSPLKSMQRQLDWPVLCAELDFAVNDDSAISDSVYHAFRYADGRYLRCSGTGASVGPSGGAIQPRGGGLYCAVRIKHHRWKRIWRLWQSRYSHPGHCSIH